MPSRSFHDSNIEHEQALVADAAMLRHTLTLSLRSRERVMRWRSGRTVFVAYPENVSVAAIQHTADGQLLARIEGPYTASDPVGAGVYEVWIQILVDSRLVIVSSKVPPVVAYGAALTSTTRPSSTTFNAPMPPLVQLLPAPPGAIARAQTAGQYASISMDVPTAKNLISFYNAAEGDPYFASQRFLRMAYLSAVTVTTLGLGDITPVSTAARFAVSIEAVLGVVFVGLFLNAIARRR